MTYSISDLVNGANKLASSVFGKKSEYELQFNHEEDGCWYVDFPGWPFDHHNLMMVAGADRMCDVLSEDGKFAYIKVRWQEVALMTYLDSMGLKGIYGSAL